MTRGRKFLVHISCRRDETGASKQFLTRISPWASRASSPQSETGERIFEDECELIEIINSVLPKGSDIRNIFSLIESPEGFYYLLQLDQHQARCLGWRLTRQE